MIDGSNHLSELTLHVVLATFPQTQEKEFDISVKDEFYQKYRTNSQTYLCKEDEQHWYYKGKKGTPVLYNPLSYYILGNYDVAYITLIDSFKFAQRLFEPKPSENHKNPVKLFAPHTFQSFTGIAHHSAQDLKSFFYDHLKKNPSGKHFLGICNLKLNNGFLIGNGESYLNTVLKAIDTLLTEESGIEYLKLQSFSWFELSLMIFGDDPQQIANIIQKLRRLTMENLLKMTPNILDESLYKQLYKTRATSFFQHANVFADTHTYIGIHSDVFNKEKKLSKTFFPKKFKLRTEVEWQIKPGHMHILAGILADNMLLKKHPLPRDQKQFLAGRSDYSLKVDLTDLTDVVKMIGLIMDKKIALFEHARKVKTNIYFDGLDDVTHSKKKVIKFHEKLTSLAEDTDQVYNVNVQMKALKLSRQIRSKVLKIFSNYNNGVQDIVLFPYLLDFKIFIGRLKSAIDKAYTDFMARMKHPEQYQFGQEVDRLEDILMKMIDIFQEGFNIRMLNPYQFEDINDFDLDFNSSIQQLLSVYSTIAFEIGNLIYNGKYNYGPVIQLNLKDTVSNDSSINYYVHHLTSPEFVFATLTKEIINALPEDDEPLEKLIEKYQVAKLDLLKINPVIRNLDQRSLVNFTYFFNDAFRYIWTYKMDFRLFYYWFWTYNFQNASLYNEMGLLEESHFEKELFRILFIAKFFKTDHSAEVKCPLPELETYWERHYQKIANAVNAYIKFLHDRQIEDEKGKVMSIAYHFIFYIEKRFYHIMQRSEADCKVSVTDEAAKNEATKFQSDIEIRYSQSINVGNDYAYYLARRCMVMKSSPKPPEGIEEDSVIYLEWYMWRYLNEIAEMNDHNISLVRRNWETGEPMVSFVKQDRSKGFSVDQTGGLFFDDMNQQRIYFERSSRALLDLWTFSLRRKKHFIIAQSSKK